MGAAFANPFGVYIRRFGGVLVYESDGACHFFGADGQHQRSVALTDYIPEKNIPFHELHVISQEKWIHIPHFSSKSLLKGRNSHSPGFFQLNPFG
jgi:hypothetical protein